MTDHDDSTGQSRRTFLKTVPAVAATAMVGSVPATAASVDLSPLAKKAGGWVWWVPDEASIPTYGDQSVPAFHVGVSADEDLSAVGDWVTDHGSAAASEHDQYRHTESGTTVVAAAPKEIGVAGILDQTNTLVSEVDVAWLDVVQDVERTQPLSVLASGPSDASIPRAQRWGARVRGEGDAIDSGLAFDGDTQDSTLQDARYAANSDSVTTAPTGTGLTAAIVDTGVDDTAAMEDGTGTTRLLSSSKNVAGGGSTGVEAVADGQGHGTHVAETVAGNASDGQHDGWAPAADVLGVKVLGDDGSGTSADVAAGIRYAADENADVMTLSLGGMYSEGIDRAVSYAAGAGTLPVAAAGNARMQGEYVSHPAANTDAVAVAATTVQPPADTLVANFSNPGPQPGTTDLSGGATNGREPDIGAPGTSIRTASEPHLSGTSMAAPHVAGAALWLLSETNLSTPEDVKQRLTEYAAPAPKAGVTDVGNGVLDVYAALNQSEPDQTQEDARNGTASDRDDANRARANGLMGGRLAGFLP